MDGVEAKLSAMVGGAEVVPREWIEEEYRVNNSPGAAESFAELARYFDEGIDEDLVIEYLARVDVPVLLLWGVDDVAVPVEIGRRGVALLSRGRLEEIARAGHVPYYVQPDRFNELILEFLA